MLAAPTAAVVTWNDSFSWVSSTAAADDVHQARVFGRAEDTTGVEPFGRLVEQVMTPSLTPRPSGCSGVVDNGSSHRGQASVDRLEAAWPALRLVHLPVPASWLDQAEIYFSVVQRKVVDPNDFFGTDEVARRLAAFEDRYNTQGVPFDWGFGRDDLDRLLTRLGAHQAA